MYPTRDHDLIRRWAAKQDAVPAEIKPIKFDGEPSVLYFLFGSAKTGTPDIVAISWDDFFARFDVLNLSMVFDDCAPTFEILRVEKGFKTSLAH